MRNWRKSLQECFDDTLKVLEEMGYDIKKDKEQE